MTDQPQNSGAGESSTQPSYNVKKGIYDFSAIEAYWQKHWKDNQTFRTLNPGDSGACANKPKYYILDMFPYPSGAGLHVGHPVGYCATDIIARYKRMRGFNVLHPIGFDAFGLPAEQYAIETNVHPATTTKKNIDRYREQLQMFGFSYDWNREFATCDPPYYKFTQWIFLRLYQSWYDNQCIWKDSQGNEISGKARPIQELIDELESGRWGVNASHELVRESNSPHRLEWADFSKDQHQQILDQHRLAYLDEIPVNWCPALGTVLANEEVDSEGRSDRGNHPVFRRPLKQWMLRITKYADRLLTDLDPLDWPDPIKLMQRNWIGRSTGAEVVFPLESKWKLDHGKWVHYQRDDLASDSLCYENFPDTIRVYTTRPDTLFGATYMVIAPEHEWVDQITTPQRKDEIAAYVKAALHRSELDRTTDTREKTGVFTGAYAINPVNGERISIWVADYVLMGYGTGAIMAVPGSDSRDFEFAKKYDLPIITVVKPTREWIQQRIRSILESINENASTGFDRVAEQFPELIESIEQHRKNSTHLSDQTINTLREKVGVDQLINHYIRHPQAWNEAYTEPGESVNSPANQGGGNGIEICNLNGLSTLQAKEKITDWFEDHGVGRAAVNFKMRDWIFSRQKYWGEPFPVLHDQNGHTIGVCDDDLPVELPPMDDFKPIIVKDDAETLPEPPLGRAKDWVTLERDGKTYRRDLNTMPQWAGSCWYYLRFIDPHNTERICDQEAERYWMPIDLYVGGAEHAVLHLLYARFWHKVLFDLGFVSTREPFHKLFNQGMIQSFAYRNSRGLVVGPDQVDEIGDDQFVMKNSGEPVTRVIAKMSKALKNVVNPDEIINEYGADTFRMYEMYMGPLETSKPWNTRDVPGLHKLCQRIWRLIVDEQSNELSATITDDKPDDQTLRMLHKTIKRITEDLEQLKFNTAIAAIFDFVNYMTPQKNRPRSVMKLFVKLIAPFAPHLGEELWKRLDHAQTITFEAWPDFDESLTQDELVEIAIQICGKVKARITVPADIDEKALESIALADDRIIAATKDKTIRKVIIVKGRLVNIVAN